MVKAVKRTIAFAECLAAVTHDLRDIRRIVVHRLQQTFHRVTGRLRRLAKPQVVQSGRHQVGWRFLESNDVSREIERNAARVVGRNMVEHVIITRGIEPVFGIRVITQLAAGGERER